MSRGRRPQRIAPVYLDIILIGPYGAGKGTLARLVAQKLGWFRYSLDDEYYRYLEQMQGFNWSLKKKMETRAWLSPKWQPYNIYVIERFLDEHSEPNEPCVFDFGAGYLLYDDREFINRAQQILAPYPNTVLILPSPDREEALQIVLDQIRRDGRGSRYSDEEINRINGCIIRYHSKHDLAKIVVYTKGKSPEETKDEICQRVKLASFSL